MLQMTLYIVRHNVVQNYRIVFYETQHLLTIACTAWTSTTLVHIPALKNPPAVNAAVLHAAEIAKCDSHCNIELEHCLYHNASLSQQCLTVYYSCVSTCSVNPEAQNVVTNAPTLKSTHLQHLSTQKSSQTQPTTTLRPSLTSTMKLVVTDASSITSYPPSVVSTAKTVAAHHATDRSTILA